MTEIKKCTKCGIEKNENEFYVYFKKSLSRNVTEARCKKCFNESAKIRENKLKEKGLRKCDKCKSIKSISNFGIYNGNTRRVCNDCMNKENETKTCIVCNESKSLTEFNVYKRKSKYESICRECIREERRKKENYHYTFDEMRRKEIII